MDCPHAVRCTGCPLIALDTERQLETKATLLAAALARHRGLDGIAVGPVVGADPPHGYRVRAKLVVGRGGAVGLYARGGHEVLDLPGCRVLTPEVARGVAAVRALARRPPPASGWALVPAADGGALVGVDVRECRADGVELLVTLIVDPRRAPGDAEMEVAARALMEAEPSVAGVSVSLRRRAERVLGAPPRHVAGAAWLPDVIDGVAHRAVPGAFVQAHRGQAARLHRAVREGLEQVLGSLAGKRVYDVYGGSGAIGLALARAGARVTLIEPFAPAARAAREAGLEVLEIDAASFRAEGAVDAVVVDPPRRGLGPRVRANLAAMRPAVIAYVSCAPDTLARDLAAFRVLGLIPGRVLGFDMIPQSDQVEALALIEPGARPAPTVLFESAELVIVDKPPHEPTTPQGEHPASLLHRVRALPGAAAAVPMHRLDLETSGVALFARSGAHAARWQPAFNGPGTRKRYVALVRGVTRDKGVVNRALIEAGHERAARTRYRRLAVVAGHSLLEVEPDEGRKHQVRRHLAGLGHAVVGDRRYGHAATNRHFEEKHGVDRQLLHLASVELTGPGGGAPLRVTSPLPGDFLAVLERLGFPAEILARFA